jgi:alkylation response protein AidB-like acyl-CoA dehydrogenase
MDFDFSDDQEQLRDAVRKWVGRAYNFERRRAIAKEGGFSGEAWGELAELGLTGLYIPEDEGGLGMGPIEGMVVMEELGRGIVLEPLAQSLIAGGILAAYTAAAAPADLKTTWLPGIASGERIVVVAHVERNARYHLDVCETTATQTGGHWEINGLKSLVPVGDQADAYLVPAQVQGKIGLFLVERTRSGVNTQGYGTVDGARAAEVSFKNAAAQLVTTEGLSALEHAVDIGIAALCAEAVGVMDQALAATVDYMNTRKQFGVTLATFQALRHRVADMKMQLELARSMSYYASLKLNAPADERRRALARAKVQLGQSMRFIGQQAVQLHGGIGVTDELIVSHYFKKLTQLELSYGDTLHAIGEVSARMQDTAGVFA